VFSAYSIVWAVIEGVDVVADNAAHMLGVLAYRAVCAARGGCGGVVAADTARRDVLSEKTATPASARITIDA